MMDATKTTLPLLPRPTRLEVLPGETTLAHLPVEERVDPSLLGIPGEEMYRLEIGVSRVSLIARRPIGLRWARATLAQLKRLGKIPCLLIEDAPRFAQRGLMLDISRNRVPSFATLRQLVDRMASWKMNHLQLYVENTIAYQGHEDAWRDASPLTLEEVSALDAYAAEKGVALTANQNCLGHFERWLKHPRYAPLAEVDRPSIVMEQHFRTPNTLCVIDKRSIDLIDDLLRQLLPRCSGTYANIGCDEPWDLGRGRSRVECEEKGRDRVFSEYVAKVSAIARREGKKPMFWCDPHPNEDGNLLGDVVALIWGYDASEPMARRAAEHRTAGREIWVVPGTSCWNSTTGRTWNRRENLDQAACLEAEGFLCTAWGDDGHRQPWPLTMAGFADAAMAAWSGPGCYDEEAVGWHAFDSPEWGPWLARLGEVDESLCRGREPDFSGVLLDPPIPLHNQTALWQEMNTPYTLSAGRGDRTSWEAVGERLEYLRQTIPGEPGNLLSRESRHGLEVALWTVEKALLRRANLPVELARGRLTQKMCDLAGEFSDLWLARSRLGGLADSVQRYGTISTLR